MRLNRFIERIVNNRYPIMAAALGIFVLGAGISKFVMPGIWEAYNPGWFLALLPVDPRLWTYGTGMMETVLGVLILYGWKRYLWTGIITGWLFGISVAVASIGIYDVAYRDLGLTAFAFAVTLEAYARR